MKILNFKVEEVVKPLSIASSIVNPKNTLPILGSVRIQTNVENPSGTTIRMITGDSEMWMETFADVSLLSGESDKDIDICIEAKNLLTALKNLGAEKLVRMEIDEERHIVTCKYGNGEFTLPCNNAEEFPMPDLILNSLKENGTLCDINAQHLQMAIERTEFASANDELRPNLNGVFVDFTQEGMVAVATDGHKLVKHKDLTIKNESNANCILSKKVCTSLLGAIANNEEENIAMRFNDKCVQFSTKGFSIMARLIEGRYPNYDAVIPKDNDKHAVVEKAIILDAIRRVMPMSSAQTELLVLKLSEDTITLSCEDVDFSRSASETIKCQYKGEELAIGFKGSYLIQLLQNVANDFVKFELKDEKLAGVIREGGYEDINFEYVSILMPMMINA